MAVMSVDSCWSLAPSAVGSANVCWQGCVRWSEGSAHGGKVPTAKRAVPKTWSQL